MSTPLSTSGLLRRVAARAGMGVWRNRGGVLVASVALVGIAGYMAISGFTPMSSSAAGLGGSASDNCADTAMAAFAQKTTGAAQAAYQCMAPGFQQHVPEQVFLQQMQSSSLPDLSNLSRVADYRPSAGGEIVYYAADANGQSIGYIVYLGPDGKVQKIQ